MKVIKNKICPYFDTYISSDISNNCLISFIRKGLLYKEQKLIFNEIYMRIDNVSLIFISQIRFFALITNILSCFHKSFADLLVFSIVNKTFILIQSKIGERLLNHLMHNQLITIHMLHEIFSQILLLSNRIRKNISKSQVVSNILIYSYKIIFNCCLSNECICYGLKLKFLKVLFLYSYTWMDSQVFRIVKNLFSDELFKRELMNSLFTKDNPEFLSALLDNLNEKRLKEWVDLVIKHYKTMSLNIIFLIREKIYTQTKVKYPKLLSFINDYITTYNQSLYSTSTSTSNYYNYNINNNYYNSIPHLPQTYYYPIQLSVSLPIQIPMIVPNDSGRYKIKTKYKKK